MAAPRPEDVAPPPLLVVENLRVAYPASDPGKDPASSPADDPASPRAGPVPASAGAASSWHEVVRGVSFKLGRERLGIVGESGSGKSQTGRAILGLTAPGGVVSADRLAFDGIDLLTCPPRQRRSLRGGRMAMVLQDPKYALDPVLRIGAQLAETLQAHHPLPRRAARDRVHAALAEVGIDDPVRVARLYPHQLSGGMGQRAMIAMMLIAGPELLIADEPTSALDVTVQLQVLGILDRLVAGDRQRRGMGLIFISHDLRLVSSFCDRVLVMYGGRVVEEIAAADLAQARHPYTQGLLNCLPQLGAPRHPLPTLQRQAEWLRG